MTAVVHDHSLPTVGAGSSIKPGEVLLEVKDVELRFGGVKAISGVSFDVKKGEMDSSNLLLSQLSISVFSM